MGEIARSLISEDYRIMTVVALNTSYFIKLRHRFNRNMISVIGNYSSRQIRLFKNGRLIKEENI